MDQEMQGKADAAASWWSEGDAGGDRAKVLRWLRDTEDVAALRLFAARLVEYHTGLVASEWGMPGEPQYDRQVNDIFHCRLAVALGAKRESLVLCLRCQRLYEPQASADEPYHVAPCVCGAGAGPGGHGDLLSAAHVGFPDVDQQEPE